MKKQEFKKMRREKKRPWDISKSANIQIIRMPEREEEEQEIENLFEKIMKINFLYLMKEMNIQVREAQRVPKKLDPKRTTPRHIIIKMIKVKDKERILKTSREKQRATYKGVPIKLSADFPKEALQAIRDEQEVFKIMKSKDL